MPIVADRYGPGITTGTAGVVVSEGWMRTAHHHAESPSAGAPLVDGTELVDQPEPGAIWDEHFNYADGSDLSTVNAAWVETGLDYLISNPSGNNDGVAYTFGAGVALRETSVANHQINAEAKLVWSGDDLETGIVAAAADATHYLLGEFGVHVSPAENKVGLYLRNGGTHTTLYELTGQSFATEQHVTIGVALEGSTARLYLNGTELWSGTLTSGQLAILGTKAGMRNTWGLTNLKRITALEVAAPPATAEGTVSGAVTWGAGSVTGTRTPKGAVTGAVTWGAGSVTGKRVAAGTVTGAVLRGAGTVDGKRVAGGAVTGAVTRGPGSVAGTMPGTGPNSGLISGAVLRGAGSVTGARVSAGSVTGAVTRGPGAVTGARASAGSVTGAVLRGAGTVTGTRPRLGSVTGAVLRGPGSVTGEAPSVGVNDGAVSGAVLRGPGTVTGLRPSLGAVTGAVLRGPGAVLGARPSSGSVLAAVAWGPGQVLGFAGANLPGTVVLTVGQSVELDMTAPDVLVALSLASTAVLTLEG